MIEKHVLRNGVRVVIERIPSVRSVALGIWVGTGSKYESIHNNGISHFIEHMLFKGTKNRTAREIAEAFDEIGGNVNAFTSKEYTCYYAKVLDQHTPLALEILADMFFNSLFEPEELEKEKKVVIEEIRMYEDTPDDLVHELIAEATFTDHPLGFRILGTEETVRSFTREHLLEYIDHHYTPDQTVVTAAGNLDDSFLPLVERYFSHFERKNLRKNVLPASFTAKELIRKKETEQAHLCLALPGYPAGHELIYSLILLNNVLGGSMSSRLFQEVREEKGLAYSVFSYHSSFSDTGSFTIYAGTAPEQVDQVVEIIGNILVDLRDKGIKESELAKGKEQLKGSLMLNLESTNSRMSRLGKNELLLGYHLTLDEILQKIDEITLDSVKEVSATLFSHPFSFSMVSPLSSLPNTYRRDQLVKNGTS
ncbi:pitrilysin family protein [Bacillaceae bacterium]